MTPANASTALATVLLDELVRCGVRDLVLAPGSRSAALAFAALRRRRTGSGCTPASTSARPASSRVGHRPHQPPARRGRDHQRHGGREPAPGRARGVARRRAAGRCSPPTGRRGCAAPTPTRPPSRPGCSAARCGCSADVPAAPPGQRRGRAAAGRRLARAGRARGGHRAGPARRAARPGAPEPPARGAAGARGRRRLGQRARRRPARRSVDDARRPAARAARRRSAATCAPWWSPATTPAPRPGCSPRPPGWPLLAEPTSGSRTGDSVIRTYRLLLSDPDAGRPASSRSWCSGTRRCRGR